jgi:hypothetical protein
MPRPTSPSESLDEDSGSVETRSALVLLVLVLAAVVCGATPALHTLVSDAGLVTRTVAFAVATVAVAAAFLAVIARRR